MTRSRLAIAAFLSLTSLVTACRSPDRPGPILQFALVAEPGEQGNFSEHDLDGKKLRIGPLQTYSIEEVRVGCDAMGRPALRFEIADSQKAEFTRWTGNLVDHRMAILIDGK